MPRSWVLLRLVLLLLTAVGIVGMHTVGHGGIESHSPVRYAQPMYKGVQPIHVSDQPAHGGDQSIHLSDEATQLTEQPSHLSGVPSVGPIVIGAVMALERAGAGAREPGTHSDPFVVCLAILAAGLVVLMAALRAAGRRRTVHTSRTRLVLGVAVRGPPPRVWIGLRLADLSVRRN